MWLSYIIPLYNCEKYIATCLDSVLNQGLASDEYEVVVVNDGSTDNGAEIVTQYCQKYENFRLIDKENGGVSSARNRGIDEAKGEYIYFMDADDYLLPGGMKILRDEYLERYGHADMVGFWCHTVDEHYNMQEWERIRPHKLLFQGTFLEYGNLFGIGWSACFQLISRNLLLKYKVRFMPYVHSEDTFFMMSLFRITDATIIATNLDIYRYYVRESSALNRNDREFVEKTFNGFIELAGKVREIEHQSLYRKEIFENEIKTFQRKAFIRLCSSSLSYKDIKNLLDKAIQADFFPVKEANASIHKFINKVYNKPLLVYLFSLPFRHIFIPYIKPYVKRN